MTGSGFSGRSVAQLITDVVGQVTTLVQTEVRLARTEIGEKIAQVAAGAGMLAGAAVVMLVALIMTAQAIASWLMRAGLAPHWAETLVAVVLLAVGGGLLMKGLADLKASNLTPDRTLNQLRRDATVAKEQI